VEPVSNLNIVKAQIMEAQSVMAEYDPIIQERRDQKESSCDD